MSDIKSFYDKHAKKPKAQVLLMCVCVLLMCVLCGCEYGGSAERENGARETRDHTSVSDCAVFSCNLSVLLAQMVLSRRWDDTMGKKCVVLCVIGVCNAGVGGSREGGRRERERERK